MLHTLLFILKIIGIILLVILCVIVFMICCALFVPVRYRLDLTRREGDDEPPVRIKAKVTWLLHLVSITVRYPSETIVRARVFFITLLRIPKKEKDKKHAGKSSDARQAEKTDNVAKTPSQEGAAIQNDASGQSDRGTPSTADAGNDSPADSCASVQTDTNAPGEDIPHVVLKRKKGPAENGKVSFKQKMSHFFALIKGLITKIKELFQNMQYTIQNICDKIKFVLDNIQYYREVIKSSSFQNSLFLCKGELAYLLKKLKPDKFRADFIIGMGDPAATGEVLAVYGMLYPFLGAHVNVAGDFDTKRIEGSMSLTGHMCLFTFLKIAVKVYFNKDVKNLIRLLKKEAV